MFVGRDVALPDQTSHSDAELRHLDLLYRDKVEFAVGHGVAVHAEVAAGDPYRATSVRTAVIPRSEVAKVEAPGPDDPALDAVERELLGRVTFDMEALSRLDGPAAAATLRPLADAYDHWLGPPGRSGSPSCPRTQADGGADGARRGSGDRRPAADRHRAARHRTRWRPRRSPSPTTRCGSSGSTRWSASPGATTRTLTPARRRGRGRRRRPNWSWRPFQLAFVLVNLPALADPTHPERQLDTGTADLLFFPTGGGKTEAYLGLTAFTLAIRRLQGEVAGHSGEGGVGVLMRYTLRLLTAQQFQRAATLICACEVRRRELVAAGDDRWGETPFRIGMWVGGSVSANKTQDAAQALDDLKQHRLGQGRRPDVAGGLPVVRRGARPANATPSSHPQLWRTLITCGDSKGRCPFTRSAVDRRGHPGRDASTRRSTGCCPTS